MRFGNREAEQAPRRTIVLSILSMRFFEKAGAGLPSQDLKAFNSLYEILKQSLRVDSDLITVYFQFSL